MANIMGKPVEIRLKDVQPGDWVETRTFYSDNELISVVGVESVPTQRVDSSIHDVLKISYTTPVANSRVFHADFNCKAELVSRINPETGEEIFF